MTRLLRPLTALLLGTSLLGGCASLGADSSAGAKLPVITAIESDKNPPADLEDGVRQAQLLRLAGKYDEAVHILSQLMLVASDDPRVVGEYGKTLAEQGRAQDAVQFLGRAIELSTNDWTIYSALGVANDQLGHQDAAKSAYEHALALKPGEPSVLNNYALSRLLADDPQTAHQLIERAQIAGGASDPKIARNIAMIDDLVPAPRAHGGLAYAVEKPLPSALVAQAGTTPAAPVRSASVAAPFVNLPEAPRQSMSAAPGQIAVAQAAPVQSPAIIMQQVPVDALAGPVGPATHAPRPLADHAAPKETAKAAQAAAHKMIADQAKTDPAPAKIPAAAKKEAAASKTQAPTAQQKKAAAAAQAAVQKMIADADAAKKAAAKIPAPRGALDKQAAKPAPNKTAAQKNTPQKSAPPALRLAADSRAP